MKPSKDLDEQIDEILSKTKQIVTTNYAEVAKWSAMAHLELTAEAKQQLLALIDDIQEKTAELYEEIGYKSGINYITMSGDWVEKSVVEQREREARIDELKHIREFCGQAIDKTLSDKPFNFVALQDIDNRIEALKAGK